MAFHAHADDADLGDLAVGDQAVEANVLALVLEQRLRAGEVGLRHGEGHVGLALVAAHVLDDHVDIDAGRGERFEDMRHRAGLVGDAGEDHLGFVLVMRDAGHVLAFHVALLHQFIHFVLRHDHRAGVFVRGDRILADEAGEDLHAHALFHRQPDRARLEHLGPHARELEHFLVGHRLLLARLGDDPRVGGVDSIDIGVDVAAVGTDRGRDRHRRSVRPATPQRGQPAFVRQALEAGDHRDLAALHAGDERFGIDAVDPCLGMRLDRVDRKLPAEPAARLTAQRLQRQRQQPAGDLFAAGDHHVVFRRIVERIGLAAEIDQSVGLARHGRNHHRDLVAAGLLFAHDIGHAPDTLGPRHGGAAEFHHDTRQANRSPCWNAWS